MTRVHRSRRRLHPVVRRIVANRNVLAFHAAAEFSHDHWRRTVSTNALFFTARNIASAFFSAIIQWVLSQHSCLMQIVSDLALSVTEFSPRECMHFSRSRVVDNETRITD
jgi:hypothetical protein